jgi:hypothetical protein
MSNSFIRNNNLSETYTLSDFIKQKTRDELTYRNLSILVKSHGLEVLDHNLLSDYLNDIEPYVVNMEFEDPVQQNKYKYAPDLLAYDVYGSVQLDFVILLLNDMIDYKEFDLSVVRMLRSTDLFNIFNIIYNKNADYIDITRKENNLSQVI